MMASRLDITQIFWDVDYFCLQWSRLWRRQKQLPSMPNEKRCPKGYRFAYRSRMSLSEVMTIVIAFHGSGFRAFKELYTLQVLPHWKNAFPNLVSYNRFVELMPWCLMLLCCFLNTCKGEITGISFVDSTPIEVCHPCRSRSHKVFKGIAGWGKNSMGWHFGFKLHLIISDRGELLAFKLIPGNVDDRKPVPEMAQGIFGKYMRASPLFGDRGYISQDLFEQLYEQQLQLITRYKKNMKQKLVKLIDKILLRKRALIETVNDQLKNIFQIEHSRHRSIWNFLVNLMAGLIAYSYLPKKPSLDLEPKDLMALPSTTF